MSHRIYEGIRTPTTNTCWLAVAKHCLWVVKWAPQSCDDTDSHQQSGWLFLVCTQRGLCDKRARRPEQHFNCAHQKCRFVHRFIHAQAHHRLVQTVSGWHLGGTPDFPHRGKSPFHSANGAHRQDLISVLG